MKRPSQNILILIIALSLTAAGCYTKLMTPQEFVQSQRYQVKRTYSDNSYSLNYNQSCITCHSTNELNERYEELSQSGVMSVHNGIPFDPSRWENTTVAGQPTIYLPSPDPYWPGPSSPVNPWWAPPISTTGSSSTPTAGSGTKIRETGGTRDGNRSGEREAPISTPAYSQPQTSGSTPAPLPSTPPPTLNTAPSSQPASTESSDRSRDSNSSSGSSDRTRDNGSSRDNSGARPR